MHLNAIRDLLHARSFALGFAYGGVAFLAAALVAVVGRRRIPDLAGIAFVAAGWLAVRGAWGRVLASGSVVIALAILAAGGALAWVVAERLPGARDHPLLATAIAVTPGAVVLAAVTPLVSSSTGRFVLAVATVAIAVAMRDFDTEHRARGAQWVLFMVTAGGVYLAVPDTELARVMFGVAIPFVLLSVPKPLYPFGAAGSAALAGLFTWVVVVGGRGRPGSVVGGLATIGIFVAEPLGRRLVGGIRDSLRPADLERRHRRRSTAFDARNRDAWINVAAVSAIVQFVIVLYASRVVGRKDDALAAFLILLPMAVVAVFVVPELYPQSRRQRRHRRSFASPNPHPHRHARSRY